MFWWIPMIRGQAGKNPFSCSLILDSQTLTLCWKIGVLILQRKRWHRKERFKILLILSWLVRPQQINIIFYEQVLWVLTVTPGSGVLGKIRYYMFYCLLSFSNLSKQIIWSVKNTQSCFNVKKSKNLSIYLRACSLDNNVDFDNEELCNLVIAVSLIGALWRAN